MHGVPQERGARRGRRTRATWVVTESSAAQAIPELQRYSRMPELPAARSNCGLAWGHSRGSRCTRPGGSDPAAHPILDWRSNFASSLIHYTPAKPSARSALQQQPVPRRCMAFREQAASTGLQHCAEPGWNKRAEPHALLAWHASACAAVSSSAGWTAFQQQIAAPAAAGNRAEAGSSCGATSSRCGLHRRAARLAAWRSHVAQLRLQQRLGNRCAVRSRPAAMWHSQAWHTGSTTMRCSRDARAWRRRLQSKLGNWRPSSPPGTKRSVLQAPRACVGTLLTCILYLTLQ